MDKIQSSDPKKDEDFMLMTGVAYHALCKSADLLDEINIRPWENKKTIKVKSPSNIGSLNILLNYAANFIQNLRYERKMSMICRKNTWRTN